MECPVNRFICGVSAAVSIPADTSNLKPNSFRPDTSVPPVEGLYWVRTVHHCLDFIEGNEIGRSCLFGDSLVLRS